MTQMKAVIFDLGRVLVDIDFTRGLFRKLTDAVHSSPSVVIEQLCDDELFIEYNTGRITPEEFHKLACGKIGIKMSFDEFRECWCDIFSMSCRMESLLRACLAKTKVGILSDTDPMHWGFARDKFPVLGEVPFPVLSFEEGVMKPSAEIYRRAVERVGCAPGECFFTDDLSRNVDGALAAGLDAALFEGPEKLEAALRQRGILRASKALLKPPSKEWETRNSE